MTFCDCTEQQCVLIVSGFHICVVILHLSAVNEVLEAQWKEVLSIGPLQRSSCYAPLWEITNWCCLYVMKRRTRKQTLHRVSSFRFAVLNLTAEQLGYLYLATSEMWCWSGGRRILRKLSLCCSIVCYCYGAQSYEQFLQVGWLYQALILLGLALSSERLCIFSLHGAIYIVIFWLHCCLYLLVSWAWCDRPFGWLTIVLQCYNTVGNDL